MSAKHSQDLLDNLRQAIAEAERTFSRSAGGDISGPDWCPVLDAFEELDEYLNAGGDLPTDWDVPR